MTTKITCFNCKYASCFEDRSVGIPMHLDECTCKEVPPELFETGDEAEWPLRCKHFTPTWWDKVKIDT